MKLIMLLAMIFVLAGPAFGLKIVTKEIKFEDDPIEILFTRAYMKEEEYSKDLIVRVEYKNQSGKIIEAWSFRMLFYDVFNEYLDTMSGVYINGFLHEGSTESEWKSSIYKDWATHTIIIFLGRVRFKDGTVWRRSEADITEELSELKDILFKPEQLEEKRKE